MNEQTPTTSGKRKTSAGMIAILIILLLGIGGLLYWAFTMKSDIEALHAEREALRVELQSELDSMMYEHDMIKTDYGNLSDSLTVKDSIIQADAEEIRKLLNTQWEYYKIKKKLALLQEVSQGYVRQMDSLYTVNAALTEENAEIREDLQIAWDENEVITKDRDSLSGKVMEASILQTYNLDAKGIRVRSSGKERITDKVGRVDKIRVCFTIGENKIVVPGTKEIYVRIAQPDGLILTPDRSDEYSFMYKGEMIQYSIKKMIDYQNTSMDLCLYWAKSSPEKEIQEGTYHVEIFFQEEVIGHTQFILR
ncbi:MAG: hypothetical protein ABFS05_06945 [Bacteroidota bacterium]